MTDLIINQCTVVRSIEGKLIDHSLVNFKPGSDFLKTFYFDNLTRKSACVNARGVPPAA